MTGFWRRCRQVSVASQTVQTRMPLAQWRQLLQRAAIIYDLDGVVIDVRGTYRLAYLRGIQSYFRLELGIALPQRPASMAAVHLLKRHRGFNDPAEVTAILLRLLLRANVQNRQSDQAFAQQWIAAALADGRLDRWRSETLRDLDESAQQYIIQSERPDVALALVREHYVGSAAMAQVFGTAPRLQVLGLARRDRLLADPALGDERPMAVYSGRTFAEIQWVIKRFARFAPLLQAGRGAAIEAVDTGAHKPDGAPLLRLAERLGRDVVVYVGDLEADRQALLDARRRDPGRTWLLGQVLASPQSRVWPDADAAGTAVDVLLAAEIVDMSN